MKHYRIQTFFVLWSLFLVGLGCSNPELPQCQRNQDCADSQLCVQSRCAVLLPEVRPPAIEPLKSGIRDEGQPCDPRELAWHHDRCKPGFHCAPLGQIEPSASSAATSLELDGA
ncbi:MAG: hypothetical protein EP343_25155 [Deltaproteobacteria bacterium]|nr:MAG: hypothetical protein EP343_25155 [Deltaproteobacteria bacterium]